MFYHTIVFDGFWFSSDGRKTRTVYHWCKQQVSLKCKFEAHNISHTTPSTWSNVWGDPGLRWWHWWHCEHYRYILVSNARRNSRMLDCAAKSNFSIDLSRERGKVHLEKRYVDDVKMSSVSIPKSIFAWGCKFVLSWWATLVEEVSKTLKNFTPSQRIVPTC